MPRKTPQRAKPTRSEWARIALLAMDVDGVLTDGRIMVSSDGTESKQFSILDGFGLVRLARAGVHIAWISGRASGSTTTRAEELKISHLIQGRSDKGTVLAELASSLNLTPSQCAFIGDDTIDISALQWAGIGIAVPNAMPNVLAIARHVTRRPGGFGAVREVCEQIAEAKGLSFAP